MQGALHNLVIVQPPQLFSRVPFRPQHTSRTAHNPQCTQAAQHTSHTAHQPHSTQATQYKSRTAHKPCSTQAAKHTSRTAHYMLRIWIRSASACEGCELTWASYRSIACSAVDAESIRVDVWLRNDALEICTSAAYIAICVEGA